MTTAVSIPAETIIARTKEFLFRFIRRKDLGNDQDFFALGMVNSLFAMQLVMFVEKEFRIKVENEDLDLANFRTVDAITAFVHKKLQG